METSTVPLSFSRDQLLQALRAFVVFFKSPETLAALKGLAPDELKIENYIEERQRTIFSDCGVDPEKGMSDLRKVGTLFRSDQEIMPFLMYSQLKENIIISEA